MWLLQSWLLAITGGTAAPNGMEAGKYRGTQGHLVSISLCAARINRGYERVAHSEVQGTDVLLLFVF